MVIYLDTSALLKLYVVEEGREFVGEAVEFATIVTSTVTYAEARAGVAHQHRSHRSVAEVWSVLPPLIERRVTTCMLSVPGTTISGSEIKRHKATLLPSMMPPHHM